MGFPKGNVVKFVGRVVHIYGRRMLIIRCDAAQLPRLQTEMINRRLRPVGKLVDLFGNIKSPYGLILCHDGCDNIVGEKLFAR